MTTATVDRQVETRLRQHGIRYTTGRRAVVDALMASEGPRSAAELHGDLDHTVPLSSLYRSLTVLEETGVVSRHHGAGTHTRYEMAEWLAGHHHHLVCVVCGQVDDVTLREDDEARLRHLIAEVATKTSFHPTDHSLEIAGRCVRCA